MKDSESYDNVNICFTVRYEAMYECQAVVNYKILDFVATNYVSLSLPGLVLVRGMRQSLSRNW